MEKQKTVNEKLGKEIYERLDTLRQWIGNQEDAIVSELTIEEALKLYEMTEGEWLEDLSTEEWNKVVAAFPAAFKSAGYANPDQERVKPNRMIHIGREGLEA